MVISLNSLGIIYRGIIFLFLFCFFQYHDVPRRACVQFHLGNQLGN